MNCLCISNIPSRTQSKRVKYSVLIRDPDLDVCLGEKLLGLYWLRATTMAIEESTTRYAYKVIVKLAHALLFSGCASPAMSKARLVGLM